MNPRNIKPKPIGRVMEREIQQEREKTIIEKIEEAPMVTRKSLRVAYGGGGIEEVLIVRSWCGMRYSGCVQREDRV